MKKTVSEIIHRFFEITFKYDQITWEELPVTEDDYELIFKEDSNWKFCYEIEDNYHGPQIILDTKFIDKISKIYKLNKDKYYQIELDWLGDYFTRLAIVGYRKETDEEYTSRLEEEREKEVKNKKQKQQRKQKKLEKERTQLEKLAKKHGYKLSKS